MATTTTGMQVSRSWQVTLTNFLRRSIVLIVLIILGLYFSSQTERFLQERNLVNILQQNASFVIITVGLTLVMLGGGIDLSVGSVAAFGSALSAGLMVRNDMPFVVALILTLGAGYLIGSVNGWMVVYGKLPPFVATLAMLGMARGLTLVYTQGRTISGMGDSFTFWGRGEVTLPIFGDFPVPILVAIGVILIAVFVMSQTRFGLHVYAIGGNEETAMLAGVPVNRIKMMTYGLSGMLAALGGILLAARLYSAQPQLGVGLELEVIAAAVLGGVSLFGGVGNILGAVVGGLLVGVLTNGMNLLRVASYQQQMIQGVVLVLAVAVDIFSQRLEKR